uniref:Uncharacterized protein MANES_15G104700 n=1 Tax=Rhizophora mucronata TaxID=61149 RepID=A0A2P2KA95_RHIMU
MTFLPRISSYAASILGRQSHLVCRIFPCWKTTFDISGAAQAVNLEFLSTAVRVQCYSSQQATLKSSWKKKRSDPKKVPATAVVEQDKNDANNVFFVVRKGDVVGVYKNFSECQAQVGSSICDPPVSIYKGLNLPKGTEEFLVSRGLKNALYTIRAGDLKEDLFGTLVPCPFQEADISTLSLTDPLKNHIKFDIQAEAQPLSQDPHSCILEFDGASRGNPGPAGAGAVLRRDDGSLICRLRKGLGKATNNAAEYGAIILGLEHALMKGYTKIRVQGDSKLVCLQVQGSWEARHPNITGLYEQTKMLMTRFNSFQISHMQRKHNMEADAEANLAIALADGQVEEIFV